MMSEFRPLGRFGPKNLMEAGRTMDLRKALQALARQTDGEERIETDGSRRMG